MNDNCSLSCACGAGWSGLSLPGDTLSVGVAKLGHSISYHTACAPREDIDYPALTRSLIRIFTGQFVGSQGFKVSSSGQQNVSSDCASAGWSESSFDAHTRLYKMLFLGSNIFCNNDDIQTSHTGFPSIHSHNIMSFQSVKVWFVCVEVLQPSQSRGSCLVRSVYLTTPHV